MKIELGQFARCSLESRLGPNVRVAVVAALLHYGRRLQSQRPPVPPPPAELMRRNEETSLTLEIQVNPETQEALERQAAEQHLSLSQVAVHAVFVYLADLESSED